MITILIMDTERKLLRKAFMDNKDRLRKVFDSMTYTTIIIEKSAEMSEQTRSCGNQLYVNKNHDADSHINIFRYYCQSISLAPLDSEVLAKAYASRSAFLLHIHKLEDCIRDIDEALGINKLDVLIVMKLLCRKVECMKILGLSNHQCVLDEAENCAKRVSSNKLIHVDKLINKAKACPINKLNPLKHQSNQHDNLPQVDRPLDYVSIEYDEKYGRYLTAKKDYNPGDLIFSDKLYASFLTSALNHTNCKYCLKTCWSGVPCDRCSWAMFCSDDCKIKGYDSFHEIECPASPYLGTLVRKKFIKSPMMRLSLRILLIGIREAGDIMKLKEELKLVDECTDERCKGFYKNGQFQNTTIQSVYSLSSRKISENELHDLAFGALSTLIAVVKYSKLIENFKLKKIDDVMNEDLVFLGALLIKLALTSLNNGFSLVQKHWDCRLEGSNDMILCCGSGPCLAALASLINHSCNPNACTTLAEGGQFIILAVKPIKKDSHIFISYKGNYHSTSLENRIQTFNAYNFTCECEACIQLWPQLLDSPFDVSALNDFEKKLYKSCASIIENLEAEKTDFNKKDIKKLSKTIVQAHKHLAEPNYLLAFLNHVLKNIYRCVYRCNSLIYSIETCDNA